MAQGVCRINDVVVGTCQANAPGHPRHFTGIWITGSDDVTANNLGVVRIGDIGTTDCNHTIQAIVGSETVTANNLSVVRVGDPVIIVEGGVGVTVTGSDDVTAG